MAPKKAKGKKNEGGGFSEVEKAFYELQLADCNRKLAGLRKSVGDYEIRNEELQKDYERLDEDSADIAEFLKTTLNVKTEENAELKEKFIVLEELREVEAAKFNKTISDLEKNFTRMKDQLTSENKLLAGKLNTLEEFRAIREDQMNKFQRQEKAFEDQENKYKRVIYNAEKKIIIGKDSLKKEMEERLLQLAHEFEDASELRIAASTHRVIQENITLNNQLDSLLVTQAKISEQNEKLKEDERASRCAMEVAEEERDKAINKSMVELKYIDQLTDAFENVRKQKAIYEKQHFDAQIMHERIQKLTKINDKLVLKVRVLEQNLHATLGEQNKNAVETWKLLRQRETFKNILKESAFAVQASLKMDQWGNLDRSRELIARQVILNKILDVINQYRDVVRVDSMESIASLSNIYDNENLGIDKKLAPSRKSMPDLDQSNLLLLFEDKRGSMSVSTESSPEKSLKTIASIEVMPINEEKFLPTPNESLPSFFVASSHSSSHVEEESDSITTEISRLEMQRSLMPDLTSPNISQQKMSELDPKIRLDTGSQRSSVAIAAERASRVNIGDKQDKTEKGEAASSQVHFERTHEPTQDFGDATYGTDLPTKEPVEAVAVDQKGEEEDKKNKTSTI